MANSLGTRTNPAASLPKLTPEQLDHYAREGYVEAPGVFPPEELAEINREIDRIRAEKSEGQDANNILKLGLRSPLTRALCADERVLSLVEQVVKPGIAIYSAKMVEKRAHDPTICHWHQDNAYYNKKSHSQCRMSVWIPLQDADETNGCLWVVPRSHGHGTRPAEQQPDGVCKLAFADGREEVDGAVPYPIKAGSILLFHADLYHRSLGNQTDQTRRSFIVSYQEATCPRGNGEQHKILREA